MRRRRRSDRGAIFAWALVYIVLIGMALSFALASGALETRAIRQSGFQADALHEARGGVRRAAANDLRPITEEDDEGRLEVVVKGDAIEATFTLNTDPPVTRRVSARWMRGPSGVDLFDWREE